MPVRPPLPASRRTALGGALLGLTAAGCSADRPAETPRRPAAVSATARPDEDPDTALVDDVLAELTSLVDLAARVGGRFARIRPEARALEALHDAHRETLGYDKTGRPAWPVPRLTDAASALLLVRRRELRAQQRLVDWSVAAESGALARLLAAMSAGIAQQVATLPATPGPKAGAR